MAPITETIISIGVISTVVLLVVALAVTAVITFSYVIRSRASHLIDAAYSVAIGTFETVPESGQCERAARGLQVEPETARLTVQEEIAWTEIANTLRKEEF